MGINPALSASLRVLSFVAALFVVAIHSNSIHYAVNPAGWSVSFHRLFCNVLSSWAVPYFFFLGVAVAVYLPRRWLQGSGTPLVLPHVLNYAFWLYCSHNLVICYAGPATRALFGTGSIAIVAATTVSWTCSVAVGLGSAYFVERRFPRVFAVMNGGR